VKEHRLHLHGVSVVLRGHYHVVLMRVWFPITAAQHHDNRSDPEQGIDSPKARSKNDENFVSFSHTPN
jgi:hypothetical protein